MITNENTMDLTNIGNGAAVELFKIQLQKVLNNILDINTVEGAREINLKFKLSPNDRRDEIGIEISCASKIGAIVGFKTAATIEKIAGRPAAYEFMSKQQPLFENVTNIRKETENND